ncbi:hypothetical protein L0636_10350 [Halomonas janggokensis]|jgi:hypothetical protein|uniref:Peptidase inhibitor I78 family protein n=1 Tax=Vreelandella janggokensis TaxID=370767 RepID=A0ABT4IVM0_9GAMM|nr:MULTISPECIES: I78 family peptidase inhibitor [Halomonas]MCZ0927716.1 hypothetical protein [Halomonas janggokensis]MCZ0930826.1 hypothetical protein [Halomonas janggokensis]QPL45576.1 hypothetical protein IT895_15615 [Halomonas sp. A40-4]
MMCWRGWQLSVLTLLSLFLAACAQTPGAGDDVPSAPPPPQVGSAHTTDDERTACRLEDIQFALGAPIDGTSSDALAQQSGAQQVRVLRPEEAATLDHRPGRLNIHLDDNDVIEKLSCG